MRGPPLPAAPPHTHTTILNPVPHFTPPPTSPPLPVPTFSLQTKKALVFTHNVNTKALCGRHLCELKVLKKVAVSQSAGRLRVSLSAGRSRASQPANRTSAGKLDVFRSLDVISGYTGQLDVFR